MSVSVITVSYHTGPVLLDMLRATLAQPEVAEIVVVDNGNPVPARRDFAALAAREPRIRLLQGHGNSGFARACDYGAALSRGRHLLFLNPDAVPEAGAVRALLEAGENRAEPWIAGGRLVDGAGAEQAGSRRRALTLATLFGTVLRLPGLPSINRYTEPVPDAPIPVDTVSGACLMMSRVGYRAAGRFDPGYFLHVEDIALCRAAREAGGDVVFVPGARIRHEGGSSDSAGVSVERHKLQGFLRYFWTNGSGVGAKTAAVMLAPLLAGAIFGRLLWRSIRR